MNKDHVFLKQYTATNGGALAFPRENTRPPYTRGFGTVVTSTDRSGSFRLERAFWPGGGGESHPLKHNAFARCTEI